MMNHPKLFLNETISILESDYSGQEIQDVGTWSAMGIALALIIVAIIGFVIKGLFAYYIKYEAPKERPINTMILSDQTGQIAAMSMITSMTVVPIATQKPLYKFVGRAGCQFYWGVNMAYQWLMIISGVGMATYRLICFHYLFKKELNTKKIAKWIIQAELAATTVILSLYALMYKLFGWEKAMFFQFCMNLGTTEVNTILDYTYRNERIDTSYFKMIRIPLSSFGQALMILELAIYAWILFNLWKHDKDNHKNGIITETMKKERNQKNVITLYGQVATFVVETAISILILVHLSKSTAEVSFLPISQVVGSTTISIIQLATSHEMRRFLKNQFNLY